MSDGPKISSTFARSAAAAKETDLEVGPPRSTPPRLPVSGRPRLANAGHGAEKATSFHLDDDDLKPLEQLSPLLIGTDFSIRRGLVLGGRFRVTRLIGAGAQCYVYAAEHTTLKSQVAIKCLQPALVTPELVERFAREAQALTSIRNAHVAAVLDVGRAPCGTPFIVMEYLEGADLSALLETRPRLEQRQAAEIVLQTCEGLAAAHALGLVHQDIKPSNIFLSDEMGIVKAKVVDFGVARVAIAKTDGPAKFTRSRLDDTIGGTPFYMSPEQIFAHAVIDHRSDMFSLGMVLYEMLRGTHPFDLEMSTRQPGQAVRIERSGIDPALADIIQKCLQQDPDKRFANVAELAVALLPFAPSRARSHADAAGALLRKAGHSIGSRMPSSVPPPLSQSTMPQGMTIPAAPGLPNIPGATMTATTAAPAARRRWPFYPALALAALAGGGIALKLSSRSAAT
ncbi:MAG TPA: serine/threonine-protein kinase, partial [Labilithrix sp.]|nr:serine/threonine-protein kinase [Labilithrix sp.]